jgi:competence protein ComEA
MPTPSEQKALAFVSIVVLLAGAARVLRAGAILPSAPTSSEQQALARQAFAANSSATVQHDAKTQRGVKGVRLARKRRDDGAKTVAGVASVPFSDVRPGSPGASGVESNGLPVPWPRIDTGPLGSGQGGADRLGGLSAASRGAARGPVDLDVATVPEIEALPRIGPALARRIVGNRDSLGAFGSLEALRRVKGIGPATVRLLAPLVTFSGQARR